jgi:cyclophilin family peptidyl-prolyl cis-trans isomerase
MIWHRKPAKISLITWMLLVLLTQVFFRIVTLGNQADTVLASIEHEPTAQTGIKHRDGTISMGRFAPGETCGSFFFCIGDQPELDHGGHGLPLSARWSRAGMFCSAYSNVAKKQNFYAKK